MGHVEHLNGTFVWSAPNSLKYKGASIGITDSRRADSSVQGRDSSGRQGTGANPRTFVSRHTLSLVPYLHVRRVLPDRELLRSREAGKHREQRQTEAFVRHRGAHLRVIHTDLLCWGYKPELSGEKQVRLRLHPALRGRPFPRTVQ